MTNWKPLPDAKQRLLVSTAMLGALCVGYGRRAYAACVASPVGTYVCSGALTTTQSFSPGVPLSVSTASGFSITTAAGPAFNLTSSGVGSFTDSNSSTITGFTNGIYMEGATGSSPITITTTGDVTGQAGWGIAGRTFGGNLTINANEVNGTTYGVIGTISGGSGTLSITTTGAVVEASPSGLGNFAGIRAYNNGTGVTNIQTQAVTGVINGIYAKAGANAGGITITSNGLVTSQRYGVHTYTTGAGVSVKAPGGIQSGDAGVYIKSLGTGNTSGAIYVNAGQITVSGGTAGANRDGIYVEGAGLTTGVTIKSAGVTTTYGGQHTTATGISVLQGPNFSNVTSTGISITTTGAISAQGEYGDIFVKNEANGNVTINAGAALTATNSSRYIANGVTVSNTGTGGVSITTSTINVGGYGVAAYNSGAGGLSITTGQVTAGWDGIKASNSISGVNGSGGIYINAKGAVTTTGNVGIYARYNQPTTGGTGAGITIKAGDVNGVGFGILARNSSTIGALSITSTGTLGSPLPASAPTQAGVYVYNKGPTASVSVNNAYGAGQGGWIVNKAGTLTITSTGTMAGVGSGGVGTAGRGLYVKAYGSSSTIGITANNLSGLIGLEVVNTGTGATTAQLNGTVQGVSEAILMNSTQPSQITIGSAATVE
ncbi:beta strand repeat-containing protein, partial [Roseiarcus sp.]|uniref:beta strand repeat-containing protein n=1 Tax=Roseiarcus sp. TaxID=1969460 RepID=UPI003C37642C